MVEIECVVEARNLLGESPNWHPGEQALYWVDIAKPSIWRYDPVSKAAREWILSEQVSSLVHRPGGGLCATLRSGFAYVTLGEDRVDVQPLVNPEPDQPRNRLNDGKCDRRGRYWCGTMNMDFAGPTGALWRLDADLGCQRMEQGVMVSNGLAFSPDDRVLYFADTRADTVWAYDFDLASGTLANRREFVSPHGQAGLVDGATVDAEGYYWCARIRGGQLARYDPTGRLERTIALPVQHPTMCSFGGPGLDVLYVTCGTSFLQPGEADTQPLAGALLAVHGTGARGLPEPFFAR